MPSSKLLRAYLSQGHPYMRVATTPEGTLRWEHSGTTYSYREDDGVGELSIGGVFSSVTFRPFRRDILRYLAVIRLSGLVVDLRKVVVALDSDTLDLRIPSTLDPRTRLTPVVALVRQQHEALALEWLWQMSAAGLVRGVATDERQARAWIAARAA